MLITFEGVNGSGKTTAMREVKRKLEDQCPEYRVSKYFCPGSGIPKIRSIFKDPKADFCGLAYLFMACADQAELMHKHVIDSANPISDEIILIDRLFDSTLAYQTVYGGLSEEVINICSSLSTFNLRPNLTLLFDVPFEVSMHRRREEGWEDKFEKDFKDKFEALREKFLETVQKDPARVKIIDASLPLCQVVDTCFKYIKNVLY